MEQPAQLLRPRLCVSSHHSRLQQLQSDPEFQALACDPQERYLIELRLDRYKDLSLANLDKTLHTLGPSRCGITYRSPPEGGEDPACTDATRALLWKAALHANVAFIDVELATFNRWPALGPQLRLAKAPSQTLLLISAHHIASVPGLDTLRRQRAEAEAYGADVVKLVVHPRTALESWPLLELLLENQGWRCPLLGLALGDAGVWSRILGLRFPYPAPFTFARSLHAPGTAAGQLSWKVLQDVYRYPHVDASWPVYGIVGHPLGHSLSPLLHATALGQLSIKGVYVPFDVEQGILSFVQQMAPCLGVQGLSVTLPYKKEVTAACRTLSQVAQQVGAVNTLSHPRDGTWVGTNTDSPAARACLEEALGGPGHLKGRTVWILGAGGVAHAVAHAAFHAGAQVLISNRDQPRAFQLASRVQGKVVTPEHVKGMAIPVDVVVNATPVGMASSSQLSPLAAGDVPPASLVFDTVYQPLFTSFLRQATAAGHPICTGLDMLVRQGLQQFHIFTGYQAPIQPVWEAVHRALTAF